MSNLVATKTQIDDLKNKRDLIKEKVAGLISQTMVERAKEKSLTSAAYSIDVKNLLDGFSDEEKIDIMIQVSYLMLAQIGPSSSKDDRSTRRSRPGFHSNRRDPRDVLFQ